MAELVSHDQEMKGHSLFTRKYNPTFDTLESVPILNILRQGAGVVQTLGFWAASMGVHGDYVLRGRKGDTDVWCW